MSLFNRFRKKEDKKKLESINEVSADLKLEKNEKKTPVKSVPLGKKDDAKKTSTSKTAKVKDGVKIGTAKVKSKFKVELESVLVRPLITEKISDLAALGKYSFEVNTKANKISVKKAVSSLYGVKVLNVRISNVRGKRVRYGKNTGVTKSRKKAIVTLAPGEKIELYEGV